MNIEFEHVECDLCGCGDYKIRYRKPDNWLWLNQFEYPVVECVNCGLVYVNPRPTQKSMRYFYPQDYHDNRDIESQLERYSYQVSFLPKLGTERVLDIGCARGDFLTYLKEMYPNIELYGNDYYSSKVNSEYIKFCKKLLPECRYDNSFFDLVMAWAVFEHLHTPREYFKEVSRILKKNGKFIFLVTNSESLYGKRAYVEDIPRHTYHFSENTLKQYADIHGFELTNLHFDDKIFDGRGIGTFYYMLSRLAGVTWETHYFKRKNAFQIFSGVVGRVIDFLIFYWHWEVMFRRSGNIVVEFTKL